MLFNLHAMHAAKYNSSNMLWGSSHLKYRKALEWQLDVKNKNLISPLNGNKKEERGEENN